MGEACARLVVQQPDSAGGTGVIYVKSRWFASHFTLSISDGLSAWTCQASPEEVSRKAFSWDYTVTQYLDQAKEHLDHESPDCIYSFTSLADEARKLSWTLEMDGVQLIAHWKVEKSPNPKEITCEILDTLMSGSSRLSEELQRKTRSFENLKSEATQLIAQSQKFRDLKGQFEDEIYRKFVAVLNSKKTKLRELRDLASHMPNAGKTKDKDEFVEETESEDELDESEDEDETDECFQKKGLMEATVQAANVEDAAANDSAATEMYLDSPAADASIHVKSDRSEEAMITDAPTKQDRKSQTQKTAGPTPAISPSKVRAEAMTDAAALLGGWKYNSAPKRRRR